MCLTTIIERSTSLKENKKEKGVGWKLFYKSMYGLSGIYQGNNKYLDEGRWIHELDYRSSEARMRDRLRSDKNGNYPFGWHIYVSKKAADHKSSNDQVVRKVRYRQARTKGCQDDVQVIVAKEMFIEPR